MNKRIRELAELAGIGFSTNGRPVEMTMWGSNDLTSANLEKFAELIIREFAYDAMDVTSQVESINWLTKKWGVEL